MADAPGSSAGYGQVPVPDPTLLTTQAVDRAMGHVHELLGGFREIMETRLDGLDKATELHRLAADRGAATNETQRQLLETSLGRRLASLQDHMMAEVRRVSDVGQEKFLAVTTRLSERDDWAKEQKVEARISLDAALAAAKEAVSEQNKANTLAIGKSEAATQKQIDSNAMNTATSIRSLEDKIADIKERLDRGEGGIRGAVGQVAESRSTAADARARTSLTVSIAFAIIGLAGVIVSIIVATRGG
jgi:hypothetical protein